EELIPVSCVSWLMGSQGWTFDQQLGSSGDALDGLSYLHQRYTSEDLRYSGRVTVPLLWDRALGRVVSNESADIVRMFNTAFDGLTGSSLDFYPQALQAEIDGINQRVYETVNNGVYRAGFATTQEAYEEAFDALFESLDWL